MLINFAIYMCILIWSKNCSDWGWKNWLVSIFDNIGSWSDLSPIDRIRVTAYQAEPCCNQVLACRSVLFSVMFSYLHALWSRYCGLFNFFLSSEILSGVAGHPGLSTGTCFPSDYVRLKEKFPRQCPFKQCCGSGSGSAGFRTFIRIRNYCVLLIRFQVRDRNSSKYHKNIIYLKKGVCSISPSPIDLQVNATTTESTLSAISICIRNFCFPLSWFFWGLHPQFKCMYDP